MKDEKEKLASGVQYAQLGLAVSLQVIKTLGESGRDFTVKEIQQLIADPEKKSAVEKIAEKIVCEVFNINLDPWVREKQKITHFYKKCFNLDIDCSGLTVPDASAKFKQLNLNIESLSRDQIFEAYAKMFGEDKVYKAYQSLDEAINHQAGGEPLRPKKDYFYRHEGGVEPDQEHLNKSYNIFDEESQKKKINFFVVKEGMIAAMRYRFETGKMYDIKGLTLFHSLDSVGHAMFMYRHSDGRFDIGRNDRDYRDVLRGPRQVSF